jgi:hypothetical protein
VASGGIWAVIAARPTRRPAAALRQHCGKSTRTAAAEG